MLRSLFAQLKKVGIVALMLGSLFANVAFLTPSHASAGECKDYSNILTFPNWYRGVGQTQGAGPTATCTIEFKKGINDIWVVVSNVIEILLQLVGYIAVGFIIFGGFKYLTSQGESSALASAKNTITQAIVGLVISIVSVLILNFVVGIFGLRTQGANLEITYSPQVQLLLAEREQRNV